MSKASILSWRNPSARLGYKVLAMLVIAYGAASWAIDNGSLWLYLVTLAACYMAIHYGIHLLGGLKRGRRRK